MKGRVHKLIQRLYDFRGSPMVAVAVGVLFILEKRFALRQQQQPLFRRLKTNAAIAATALPALRLALIPAMVDAADYSKRREIGLLRIMRLPLLVQHLLSFLALDWANYLWHRLNHRWPLMWRFHQVHHADLDMDVSTALRFHVGELIASVPFKGGFIVLLGASPRATLVYEVVFELANNFHHSNLRLPLKLERQLVKLVVSPRMHGIHHSVKKEETDSNYSVIFNCWDRLHGTLCMDVPQEQVTIGLPYVRQHQSLPDLLKMPLGTDAQQDSTAS